MAQVQLKTLLATDQPEETYQHMDSVALDEALRELPHLSGAGHVDDVNVDVLGIKSHRLT